MARYVFVTGGVVSSLGKGLSSASLASLLQLRGFKVRVRKLDPYLNVDPGTMNPFQHGEVFVTDDGAETDLDIGHYERFTGISATQSDNITTGGIYSDIIKKERRGDYLGGTVQVVPHVTDRIKKFISHNVKNEDFIICEIGGTVGDIESLPFLEAIRQFSNDIGKKNSLFIHLTLVPYLKASGELKTKPTQHSVKELRSLGIQPDIIICRSERKIPKQERKKISLFCNVDIKNVIETIDVRTIYEAPISFHKEKLDDRVLSYFGIKNKKSPNLSKWKKITAKVLNPKKDVNIGIIGKYVNLKDAYKSLDEALIHGGISNDLKYARLNNIPFFGICFGMLMAIIEAARNLLNIKNASTSEFGNNCTPVVGLLEEWKKGNKRLKGTQENLGGTMRLGLYDAILKNNSLISKIYSEKKIKERHRHR